MCSLNYRWTNVSPKVRGWVSDKLCNTANPAITTIWNTTTETNGVGC